MTTIKVLGIAKLRKELKALDKNLPKELNAVAKDAAEIVSVQAKVIVPRRTGRLGDSIKPGATAKGGYVKAGTPYGKVIHFGWAKHNISPQPFLYDALDSRRDEVIARFEKGVQALIDKTFTEGVD